MGMKVTLTDRPIGAHVEGIDLAAIDEDSFVALRDLLDARGVIAIRDQDLSQAAQVAFARRFGELHRVFIREAAPLEYPELFLVSNILEDGKPIGSTDAGRFWHTDGAYIEAPHGVSLLYSIEVPRSDDGTVLGDTLFAGMAPAWEALPEPLRERLDAMRAVHSLYRRYGTLTGAKEMAERSLAFPPVSHPLVLRNPRTGRRALYLSEGYTTHIEGLSPEESEALLAQLCEHVTRPEFVYHHRWSPGELVIWDNLATLHRATFDYALPQRRLMRRATVAGRPIGWRVAPGL